MSHDDTHARHQESPAAQSAFNRRNILLTGTSALAAAALVSTAPTATAQTQAQTQPQPSAAGQKPNIVVIMGDDIGWWNIGAYHRGHDGRDARRTSTSSPTRACCSPTTTPRRAARPGRANFITGELPIRTGMTTVGQAGAAIGMPAEA